MSRRRLSGAIACGLALFLVLSGAGVSWAYWTLTAVSPTVTATRATLSATAAGVSALNTEYKFENVPTTSNTSLVIKPVTLTNTGTAPLTYSATAAISASTLPNASVKVWLWSATTATTCGTTTVGTAGTFTSLPAMPAAATGVAAGSTLYLCIATQLNTTVAVSQGLSTTATFTFIGRVGTNWITTATPTVAGQTVTTQSVFRIAPMVVSCTPMPIVGGLLGSTITVSWPAPNGATGTTATTYTITSNTGLVVTTNSLSQELTRAQVGGAAARTLTLSVAETVYGTTSLSTTQAITQTQGLAAGISC